MSSFIDGKPLEQPRPKVGTSTRPKTTPRWGLFGFLILLGLQIYLVYEVLANKKGIEDSQAQVENLNGKLAANFEEHQKALDSLDSDFTLVRDRLGVTQRELDEARKTARLLKAEQEKSVQQLNAQLSTKADSQQLNALKTEATNRFTTVDSNVTAVKTEVDATKKELEGARREIVDVKETLTQQIARNRDEVQQLRLKGERNFYEFDINKKTGFALVGDIRIGVTKTDRKKKRYDVRIVVDDNTLEKKGRTVNEPVQFLVGRTKLRYELVVNEVHKDRIVGYLSVPKDKGLAAERS